MRIRRKLGTLACLLACVLTILPMPTALADVRLSVEVDITSVSTEAFVLGSKTDITIKGTTTNTSPNPVRWLAAEVWRSPSALTTPDEVAAITRSDPFSPTGARLSKVEAGNRQQITAEDAFNPGETRTFTLTATLSDLGFSAPGAYPIGVHIRGLDHLGDVRTVGMARWLVPVYRERPSRVSIVQLTSPPTMNAPGTFASDALLRDIPRLAELVGRAERPGTSFVVDPALVDELAALAREHTTAGTPQTGAPGAKALLARIDALADSGSGYRLPYGNPNLRLAAATGELDLLLAKLKAVRPTPSATAALPLAILATSGMDADLRKRLAVLEPALILTPDATSSGDGIVRLARPATSGLSPNPTAPVTVHGQSLSELLVGDLSGQPSVVMLTTTDDTASTARERPLTPLPSGTPHWRPSPAPTRDDALTSSMATLDADASLVDLLTSDAPMLSEAARRTLIVRSNDMDATAARAFIGTLLPLITKPAVTLKVQPNFVMAGKQNTFPVTVTNNTTVPVTLTLVLRSANPQRLATPTSQPIVLRPGETSSANVALVSAGVGVVAVTASLQTTTGVALTSEQTIEITSSNAGVLGWVIIMVSGLVVIGSTVWRIRTVKKAKARSAG